MRVHGPVWVQFQLRRIRQLQLHALLELELRGLLNLQLYILRERPILRQQLNALLRYQQHSLSKRWLRCVYFYYANAICWELEYIWVRRVVCLGHRRC